MDLHGEEPEACLLGAVISSLERKTVVDVGAECGAFVAEMLRAGADRAHVIDPQPESQRSLSERFGNEPRVRMHPPHTGSVGSLVDRGELPKRVGVLRIRGNARALELLDGLGGLDCDVLLVEQRHDPTGANVAEIADTLRLRGFPYFALVGREDGVRFVRWNDGGTVAGSAGLLVFVHARALGRILPLILTVAVRLAESPSGGGRQDTVLKQEREAIADLTRIVYLQAAAADERLEAIEELLLAVNALTRERDIQALAAAERLATIHRLAAIEELERSARSSRR